MYWRDWGSEVRFALVLPLLVAGCSQWSGDDGRHDRVVVDWHCQADAETGEEQCHKRKLVDGEPIDDVIYDSRPPEQPEPQKANASGDAVRWDKQPLTAVNSISGSDDLTVENTGPAPRQPRETVDLWSENKSGTSTGGDNAESSPGISADRRAALLGVPGADASGSAAGTARAQASEGPAGYTVQLAAFPSVGKRDAFLARASRGGVAYPPDSQSGPAVVDRDPGSLSLPGGGGPGVPPAGTGIQHQGLGAQLGLDPGAGGRLIRRCGTPRTTRLGKNPSLSSRALSAGLRSGVRAGSGSDPAIARCPRPRRRAPPAG